MIISCTEQLTFPLIARITLIKMIEFKNSEKELGKGIRMIISSPKELFAFKTVIIQ